MDQLAIDAGRKWAGSVRTRLHTEGRPVAGGWPGTMTEARARASQLQAAAGLPPKERARLAKILYAAAKELWAVGPVG